jgi:hypothetical protein
VLVLAGAFQHLSAAPVHPGLTSLTENYYLQIESR